MLGMGSALAGEHPGRALSVRGGALRTFGSLAILLALTFLCLGTYMIQDQLAHPVAAQSVVLFAAAVALALALILLYYLLQLCKNAKRHAARHRSTVIPPADQIFLAAMRAAAALQRRRNLPFQRCYVDPIRIRQ